MSTAQILVDNIRTALSFPEMVLPPTLQQYAHEYAGYCEQWNNRMEQCIPHLHSGNFSEAIRLAEVSPDLTDLYSLLDFPEVGDWLEIVSTLGLEMPSALNPELAKKLGDAYIKHSPLLPLYRFHRLFALNGSPLSVRLLVLRAIAEAEPENIFWSKDVESYEKERIGELSSEVSSAVSNRNVPQVRALLREIQGQFWSVPVPSNLVDHLVYSLLLAEVVNLEGAFSDFDYDQACRISQSIRELLSENDRAMPGDINNRIQPIVSWMQQCQKQLQYDAEYDRREFELEELLEEQHTQVTLQNAYYQLENAAINAEREIPLVLEEHYRKQIQLFENARFFRRIIATVAVVIVSSVLSLLLWFGFAEQQHYSLVRSTVEMLSRLPENDNLEAIPGVIERLQREQPRVANTPQVSAEITRLNNLVKVEDSRREDFQRYCGELEMLLDKPPSLKEIDELKPKKDAIQSTARTSEEERKSKEIQSRYDATRKQRQSEIDRKFNGELEELSRQFVILQRGDHNSPEWQAEADEYNSAINGWITAATTALVSKKLIEQGESSASNVQDLIASVLNAETQKQKFQQLLQQIGDRNRYKNELEDFRQKCTEHSANQDAADVLNEYDAVFKVAEPLEFVFQTVSNTSDLATLQSRSDELSDKLNTLRGEISATVNMKNITETGELLATLTKSPPYAFSETNNTLSTLSKRNVWVIIKKNGNEWYYCVERPVPSVIKRKYITSFISNSKEKNLGDPEIENLAKKHAEKIAKEKVAPEAVNAPAQPSGSADKNVQPVAPGAVNAPAQPGGNTDPPEDQYTQYQFAIDASKKIVDINSVTDYIAKQKNAVQCAFSLLDDIKNCEYLDPILKCLLIKNVIDDASKFDGFFADSMASSLNIIETSAFKPTTNWMDADSPATASQRDVAKAVLQQLPAFNTMEKAVLEKCNRFYGAVKITPTFNWVGIIGQKDKSPTITVLFPTEEPPKITGSLYVLRENINGKVDFLSIGSISNGTVSLALPSQAKLQCLPVFIAN